MVKQVDDEVIVGEENNGSETMLNDDLIELVSKIIQAVPRASTSLPTPALSPSAMSLDNDQAKRVRNALEKISRSDPNNVGGDLRAMVGSYHFRFRKAVYDAMIVTASLSAGVIATIATPGPGGVALLVAVLDAIDRFQENISKLDPSELLIYSALVEMQKTRQSQGHQFNHVTASDISGHLAMQAGQAPDEDDIAHLLEAMREKNIVTGVQTDGTMRYSAVA